MMQKSRGLIVLLLIAAIMLSPAPDSQGYGLESPLTVSGDSLPQSETHQDNENDGAQIIAVIIIIIIVIFVIYCITGSDNQKQGRR